ncbi:fatty acid desaturase-domain-containing protein [Exophiala viscosa]|uniref:Delta 8-(E)-sphingolipid desaturase n=1 Tax=Exophiala viscosa TaxID=2486360 RepID=A0AAN6IAN1_9EURO|nr:fatty acid desaturase-domain-containing protein [Exophiala viscosa]
MNSTLSPKDRVWSRREIEGLIAEGRKIFILDGQVIKADAWLPYHPGGNHAILHMVGRDGTDEIRALHSIETQAYMRKFVIGKIQGRWNNFLPPIQGGTFRPLTHDKDQEEEDFECPLDGTSSSASSSIPPSPIFEAVDAEVSKSATSVSSASSISEHEIPPISTNPIETKLSAERTSDLLKYPSLDYASQDQIVSKYRELNVRIRAAGLYDCPYWAYGIELCRYILLFASSLIALRYGYYALSGAFLGMFWHQLVFTAHDSGHIGITHNYHVDSCIGIFIADYLGGLSIGWWKRNHNVHHIVTNSPEHDPDIEHMPFFAISPKFFSSLRSTYYNRIMDFDIVARWAISVQHWSYYPILLLGRFNLYRLSWEYLFTGQAPRKGPAWWHLYLEIAGQFVFWAWYGYGIVYCSIPTAWDRFVFVMISHMVTMPLHVQITLSHFAMSTTDMGVHESFAQKMLRTTMDVDCPTWLDFFHGGLQFQAVHHLFPRIPRHNLRKAQKYVKEFCEDTGIPYVIYGFTEGNQKVISRLGDVAKQVKVFEECRKACAREVVEGHGLAH